MQYETDSSMLLAWHEDRIYCVQVYKDSSDPTTWLGEARAKAAQVDPTNVVQQAVSSQLFRFAAVCALCFGSVVGVHHLEPLQGVHSQSQQVCGCSDDLETGLLVLSEVCIWQHMTSYMGQPSTACVSGVGHRLLKRGHIDSQGWPRCLVEDAKGSYSWIFACENANIRWCNMSLKTQKGLAETGWSCASAMQSHGKFRFYQR